MDELNFSKAFKKNQIFISSSQNMVLSPYKLGTLVIASGKLVICDPLCYPDTEPFPFNFSPGHYPVIMSHARTHETQKPLNAFAMIRFTENTPVKWKSGEQVLENQNSPSEENSSGCEVDSGTICFMDEIAAKIIDNSTCLDSYEESLLGSIEAEFLETSDSFCSHANLVIDSNTKANIIAFSPPLGDGCYSYYFGCDTKNDIVSIVVPLLLGNFEQ